MKQNIALAEIVLDKGLQSRAGGISGNHVADLVFAYESKESEYVEAPRVWIIKGRPGYFLTRGFHRHAAFKKLDKTKIECEVKNGEYADAVLDAATSNLGHGLKRSNDDKKRCAEMVLRAKPELSDRAIAEMVAVGHSMVSELRGQLSGTDSSNAKSPEDSTKRTGLDGKKRGAGSGGGGSKAKPQTTPPMTTEREQATAQLHTALKTAVESLPGPTEGEIANWVTAVVEGAMAMADHLRAGLVETQE